MSTYKRKTKVDDRRSNPQANVELVKHASGATSSKLNADFHDLPYSGVLAAARRFAFGRTRHGRFNWKQGDNAFAEERIKHLVEHVLHFAEFRKQDDLDALICNAMMIAWYYDRKLVSTNPIKDFMLSGKDKIHVTD